MSVHAMVVALLVVASGVISAGLATAAWWNRRHPGIYWFAIHAGVMSVWSFVDFASYVAKGAWLTTVLGSAATGISMFVNVSWLLFIMTYLNDEYLTRQQEQLLYISISSGACILITTTIWTGLFTQTVDVVQWESYTVLTAEPTSIGLLANMLVFVIFFVGSGLLFRAAANGQLRPVQAAILITASLGPVIVAIIMSFTAIPDGVPLIQAGTGVSAVLYAVGFHRYDLFRFSPATERIGINRAFEDFGAGVLVLEETGTVIRTNDACCALLNTDRTQLVGSSITDILSEFDLTVHSLPAIIEHDTRYYRISDSLITDTYSEQLGRSILFVDITEQRLREQRLDVLNRVLRHNIRNELQVIKTRNEMIAQNLDGKYCEMAEQSVETANRLVATSNKARSVEQHLEDSQTVTQLDLAVVSQQLVETFRPRFPDVSFTLTGPDSCRVETSQSVELALKNLIENAAEHNDNPTPTVDITIEETESDARVIIADNGPGISEQELSVLADGQETALQHGSGMGLWAVHWVVTNSAASLDYATGADGTTVTVQIPQ